MITLVTTTGTLPEEKQPPVLAAVRRNLSLDEVGELCIVTEGSVDWLMSHTDLPLHKLTTVFVDARPTFADVIAVANEKLAAGAGTVAIANADISFASGDDVGRAVRTLSDLAEDPGRVVFALTRHEGAGDAPRLTLYDKDFLPNTLSADMWLFAEPLSVTRELFYSLGQMNCDMLLAHDLHSSGYRLFNPCLDVTILHHEDEKDTAFYDEQNAKEGAQTMLRRHAEQSNVDPWNYFGVPWLRSSWLALGYRPAQNSTNGRRIVLAVPSNAEPRLSQALRDLIPLIDSEDLEMQVICDGDPDDLVRENIDLLSAEPRIWLARPEGGVAAVRRAFLAGEQWSFERVAFVDGPDRIDGALLSSCDGIFITLRTHPVVRPDPDFGCTLVTSVFRSDAFLNGFLANSAALTGYGRMIEHVFLVAAMSDVEIDAFDKLLATQDNALILWHRKDPGLYQCWNIGIRLARTDFVSNANVDDLRAPDHVLTLVQELSCHPEAVVAATGLVPFHDYPADGTPPSPDEVWYADQAGEFGFLDLARPVDPSRPELAPHNIPHCMPVWRRSLHSRFGWFDEPTFGTYADWAFWLMALENGDTGRVRPEAYSFYFVNPTSHNRRGTDLEEKHRIVEDQFLPSFLARAHGQRPAPRPLPQDTPRRLHLYGRELFFGQHRNAFGRLIEALEPLDRGEGGCRFIPFLERQFVWGDADYLGEAASTSPRPLTDPWVGILHVPFDAPDWFENTVSPEVFFNTELFQASLPACKGIITLCSNLEREVKHVLPGVPTLALRHPTELNVAPFDPAAYRAAPGVVQVGDWLRKLQAIHRMRAPGHRRVMLLKRWTSAFLQREIAQFGGAIDPGVEMVDLLPAEEYDRLLTSSVVLCLLYATAANNVVIECIARATPILVNPLPAVVDYLGTGYPLYARNEAEADSHLSTPGLVEQAHRYLLRRRTEIDLSYQGFCRNMAGSGFYDRL